MGRKRGETWRQDAGFHHKSSEEQDETGMQVVMQKGHPDKGEHQERKILEASQCKKGNIPSLGARFPWTGEYPTCD